MYVGINTRYYIHTVLYILPSYWTGRCTYNGCRRVQGWNRVKYQD